MSRVDSTRGPMFGVFKRMAFFFLAILVGLLTGLNLSAGDIDPAALSMTEDPDRDEFLGRIRPAYLESGFQDRVDGFSGYLNINMVDIRLPGNAGMEIVVQRYYSSNVWNRVDNHTVLTRHAASADPGDHLGGSGWQLHMGKIIDPFPAPGPGHHSTLIMPDGSSHPLFNRSGYAGQKITPEGWIYTYSNGVHEITLTDGTIYQFNGNAAGAQYLFHNGSLTPVVQCTRIEDVNGNAIDIQYAWVETFAPHYLSTIESITFDTIGDHRSVEFTYFQGTNRIDDIRVMDGSTTLQTWEYSYGAAQGTFLQMDTSSRAVYPLTGLAPPEGAPWVFDYYSGSPAPGEGRFLLRKVTLPSGGSIDYGYQPVVFDTGSDYCSDIPRFAATKTRAIKGRDGSTISTWSYDYANGGKEDATTEVVVKDGSNNTVRTEEHVFHGWDSYSFNDAEMWKVGLPKAVTVEIKGSPSSDLEVTTVLTDWGEGTGTIISDDIRMSSLWTSCGSSRQMTGIKYVSPDSVERMVTRTDSSADSEYVTTTSDFDDWGNPGLITEFSDDGLFRTTEIEYWQDTTLNMMVGRIEARDPDPGGAECFKYDTKGRLTKHFVNPKTDDVSACSSATPSYAREARYEYDSDGNLFKEVRENGSRDMVTTFEDYSYGQAQKTTVTIDGPDILRCRGIGPLGTVEWETDGRGTSCLDATYRTSFDYDDLGRLTKITPPLGRPTSFVYSSDWSTATVTRGTYDIQYSFDGFGRPAERRDLETQHRVEFEYHPLGTRRRSTNWLGAEKADTLTYDALGRLTTITHPDNTSMTFAFDGSAVTRTDENNRRTKFYYHAFGDPEDRRLDKLIDADNKVTSYGYDPVFGQLNFVDAPTANRDRSFAYYSGQSKYSNGLLKTETQPETGATTFEYNRIGNVTKRTRANGTDITNYVYDQAQRLTAIDASGAQHDLSFEYNGAGLRTRMSSGQGTFEYDYDRNLRMTFKRSTIGGTTYRQDFRYDDMDRLWQTDYPNGRTVQYEYNPESRLEAVKDVDGSIDYITNISYKDWGGTETVDYQGGASTSYGYDGRFRVNSIHTTKGFQSHLQLGFAYDHVGNLETWTDYREPNGSRSFGYDKLDRLVTAAASGLWGVKGFTYNEIGDRMTATLNGTTSIYSYNSTTGRLETVGGPNGGTYGFDSLGRLTSSPIVVDVPDLTVGQPAPASQTIDEGATAVFSVVPTGGAGPYQYQWQFSSSGPNSGFSNSSNGGGLSGVTTAQLAISPVTTQRDGWYRCRVKDSSVPVQTVFSGAARLTVSQPTTGVIGETGNVLVSHTPTRVAFSRTFTNPVVLAQPPSFNGGQTSVVRITTVEPDGFTLYIHEAPNMDGSHANETVHWIVLEAGSWVLANGRRIEVGTVGTSATVGRGVANEWYQIGFGSPFAWAPAVLTQVQTNGDPHWVKTRQRNVTTSGVQMAMEQDDAVGTRHGFETVGWMAFEPSSGTWNGHPYHAGNTPDAVTHNWFTSSFATNLGTSPHLVAALATSDGGDGSQLRYRNLGAASVEIKVEEDTTYDAEVSHTTEVVSFVAIGGSGLLTGEPFSAGPQPLIVGDATPAAVTVNAGDSASFSVAASGGNSSYQYRWQFSSSSPVSGFANLSNVGGYSGVTSTRITVNPAEEAHQGYYRCRVTDGLSTVYSKAAALTVNPVQQSVVVARDTFTGVAAGGALNGRTAEIGGLTWHASTDAVLGNSNNATGLTGKNPIATLDFNPVSFGNKVITVEAKLKPKNTNWVALGFTEHVLQGWWGDGQLWVLVKSNSRYNVNVDGTELSLIGGEKPIPTTFDPYGYNTVKLIYDPVAKTAELWINAVRVMGPTAVPNGSDGLPPAIHYAGWSAMNASQNETGVDDFDLSVGAGSLKRAYDADRMDTPGDGSFPGFDVLTTTTPSKPGAPDTTQIDKATTTGSITYTWTPLDALESATTPEGTVTYTYDGDGLRIKKTFGNDDVIYIRDGSGQIIAEYDGQGHLLAEYVYAMGRRVAKISASGMRFYYHTDNVGTPLAITDQNGNLSWRGEYLPFGSEFSSTDPGDHFKFTGKELEDHTGLYYFEARYYDPVIGRFISVDPVGGNVGNSQSWNRYVYVENNPLRRIDPTGETFWDVVDPVLFAVSVGNLWRKALTGEQITAGDNWQVAGDAVGMLPIVPAIGTVGRVTQEGVEHGTELLKAADTLADGVRAATSRGLTVLGHHPGYIEKASELGARRFNIPDEIWQGMTDSERWGANQKFLDRLIKRGDEVILSTPANQARAGSFFERELQYLQSQGYELVDNGTRMVPGS